MDVAAAHVAAVPSKHLKKGKREAEKAIEKAVGVKKQKIRNKVHEVKKKVQESISTSDVPVSKAVVSSVSFEEAAFEDGFTMFMSGFKNAEKEDMKRALREHFKTCGEIKKISVDYSHDLIGTAYIDFTSMESLRKALELDNSKFRDGDRRLLVKQIKIPKGDLGGDSIRGGRLMGFMRAVSRSKCSGCCPGTGYSARQNISNSGGLLMWFLRRMRTEIRPNSCGCRIG